MAPLSEKQEHDVVFEVQVANLALTPAAAAVLAT